MTWVSTQDRLPEEGKYVVAKHSRGTWHDGGDMENVNTVVVKLVKGLNEEEREVLRKGYVLTPYNFNRTPRHKIHRKEDQFGNNEKNYCWQTFGTDYFFGQDITHWMPIPSLND